jgi:hypothetical protein
VNEYYFFILNPRLIGKQTFYIEATDNWSTPNKYTFHQQLELTITCGQASFSLDFSTITLAIPAEDLFVLDLSNESPLTFQLNGLKNEVLGCPITQVELWTDTDGKGS